MRIVVAALRNGWPFWRSQPVDVDSETIISSTTGAIAALIAWAFMTKRACAFGTAVLSPVHLTAASEGGRAHSVFVPRQQVQGT
jgi:hypothetical protein